MVINPLPLRGKFLQFTQRAEQVMSQPVVAHCPVKPFDIGILLRVTGLDIVQPDVLLSGPFLELLTDIFRTVITADGGRFATPRYHLLQCSLHPRGGQRKIHFDA
ncbi:hypothetical protein D3C85_1639290 [compost metagenome]